MKIESEFCVMLKTGCFAERLTTPTDCREYCYPYADLDDEARRQLRDVKANTPEQVRPLATGPQDR